jgi:hypothetical protein
VLGGRYMIGTYDGSFMGQPFEGRDVSGYDRVEGEYFNLWFDVAGTGFLLSKGQASEDGKTVTTTGAMKDPMSGQMMTHRMVQRITGKDTFIFEMYQKMGDAPEFKGMEIAYTRSTKSAKK